MTSPSLAECENQSDNELLTLKLRELISTNSLFESEDCDERKSVANLVENGLKSQDNLTNKYAIYLFKKQCCSSVISKDSLLPGQMTLFVTLYESIIDQSTDHLLVDNLKKFELICGLDGSAKDGDADSSQRAKDGDADSSLSLLISSSELYWIAFNRFLKSPNTLASHSRVLALVCNVTA